MTGVTLAVPPRCVRIDLDTAVPIAVEEELPDSTSPQLSRLLSLWTKPPEGTKSFLFVLLPILVLGLLNAGCQPESLASRILSIIIPTVLAHQARAAATRPSAKIQDRPLSIPTTTTEAAHNHHASSLALPSMLLCGMLARASGCIHAIPPSWTTVQFSIALAAAVARAGLWVCLNTTDCASPNHKDISIAKLNSTKASGDCTARNVALLVVDAVAMGVVPIAMELAWLGGGVLWLWAGIPLDWSLIAASAVACVSPGVVVPLLLRVAEGFGGGGGGHPTNSTLLPQPPRIVRTLLAAVAVDVLVGTTVFGVAVALLERRLQAHADAPAAAIIQTSVSPAWVLARAGREVGGGLTAGVLLGCLAGQMSRGDRATLGLFAATAAWMCLAKGTGMPGAATSGVVIAWAAAASRWDSGAVQNADKRLKQIWTYAEPMLFGLIGAALDLRSFSIRTLALAFATVAGSITIKLCATYLVTTARGFNSWDCGFAAGVWTGKVLFTCFKFRACRLKAAINIY
ncbi:hypothetical protein HDU90_007403 [Geranomyces variabilis]|nr:hypothetical protein HDU90_007403 [Geranomyces variabilis]